MATITNLGAGSGLDLEELLTKMQAAEETKLTAIETRKSSYETRISAYSKLASAVEAVQTAAEKLGKAESMGAMKASATGDSMTVSATSGAVNGSYTINVNSLATAQTLKAGAVADRTAAMGATGSFTVTLANGESETIELTDTSLNGVMKAINANDDVGVSASVITDGSGNSYLMLTAKETGTEASVASISVTGSTELSNVLNYNTDAADTSTKMTATAATDAELEINGIVVTSGSNKVTTAIDGVTMDLTAVTEAGSPITLTVTNDTSAASSAIQSFVSAYNALQNTISDLTSFDVDAETQSALTGDGTTRSIQNTLAAALRGATSEGTLRTLAAIGVSTNPTTGLLTVDTDKLNEALADHPADVTRIAGELSTRVTTAAEGIVGTDGSIATRTEGLNRTVESLQDQYDRTETSIDATMAIYRAQFTALDTFVAQQNSLADYLTTQFEALSKSSK